MGVVMLFDMLWECGNGGHNSERCMRMSPPNSSQVSEACGVCVQITHYIVQSTSVALGKWREGRVRGEERGGHLMSAHSSM